MRSSNVEFPLFLGKDETPKERIFETSELPSNATLRKLFGFLGIVLTTAGIMLTSITFALFQLDIVLLLVGLSLLALGIVSTWCAVKLEKCPAHGAIYALTLTNKRLILSTRPEAASASTKRGPQLKTYRSRAIIAFQALTIGLPILLIIYAYFLGFTPSEYLSFTLPLLSDPIALSSHLISAGLLFVPLIVFVLGKFGGRSFKKSLIAALATMVVYFFYFYTLWSILNELGLLYWILLQLNLLPSFLLLSLDSAVLVLTPLFLVGLSVYGFPIPYSIIAGLLGTIGLMIARRGAGRGGPSRSFQIPKGTFRRLPMGISHFWQRASEEVSRGGNFREQDLALNAIRNIETRAAPREVPKGRFPILGLSAMIASIAIGSGGYLDLNLLILVASGIALIVSSFLTKREFSIIRETALEEKAGYYLNRGIAILILLFIVYSMFSYAALGFPIVGTLILLLTYRGVMGTTTKSYFYAVKFVAQCGEEVNPPEIVSDHQLNLREIISGLGCKGLVDATSGSSVFHELRTPTYIARERSPLGTQNHEQRCLDYLHAFADRASSLVAATAVSFPFLAIGLSTAFSALFSIITTLLLVLTVLSIVATAIIYSGYLLIGPGGRDWVVLTRQKEIEGTFPSAMRGLQAFVLLAGVVAMWTSMSWLGYWALALLIAQGIGWYFIKGALRRIYLFGRGKGVYEGDFWIEPRGVTWTIRTPIYSYTAVQKKDKVEIIKRFEGYDSRGRYYALKNAHSIVSVTNASSRVLVKVIGVAFLTGVTLYAFFTFSSAFPWLTPWLFFIAVFLVGLVGSYGVSNVISAVVPSYGFFMDGKGAFDQFLSIDTVYPGVKQCFKTILSSAMKGRSFPRSELSIEQPAIRESKDAEELQTPAIQPSKPKPMKQRRMTSGHMLIDAGSDEELYDEIPCEICGGEGATYNVYYEQHLCRNCEARMVGIPKDLLHPDT
ncbi:MAG: hypothetical protein ACFFEA_13110 [Candidatus Thorarchaeota archaeon]